MENLKERKSGRRKEFLLDEIKKNLRSFSSSCSAAVFGTERVLIDRRVTGAVSDEFFDCSVDEDGRSC